VKPQNNSNHQTNVSVPKESVQSSISEEENQLKNDHLLEEATVKRDAAKINTEQDASSHHELKNEENRDTDGQTHSHQKIEASNDGQSAMDSQEMKEQVDHDQEEADDLDTQEEASSIPENR